MPNWRMGLLPLEPVAILMENLIQVRLHVLLGVCSVLNMFHLLCSTNTYIGDLIGYYRKTQPAPKPIYKHSRIVLKPSFDVGPSLADSELDSSSKMESEVESESEISFINANEVFPGLIMTQCPLVNPTSPFQSTLSDALLMVLQQNISVWIQIMSSTDTMPHVSLHRRCYLFPLLDFKEQKLEHGLSVRNVQVHGGGGDGDGRGSLPRGSPYLEHISTPHSIDSHNDISTVPNITNITFTVIQTSTDGIVIAERCLQYLWYNNWPDFGVPRDADDKVGRFGDYTDIPV